MNPSEQNANTRLSSPAVVALFERQRGVATRGQLLAIGVDRTAISRAAKRGLLVRMHPGVYRPGGPPATDDQRLLAACLAVDGAVVSHRAAAWLHRFEGFRDLSWLEVTTTKRSEARGVLTHHVSELADTDRVRFIPVTREARTLVDLCAVCPEAVVAKALDDAIRRRLVRYKLIEQVVAELPANYKGVRLMRSLLHARAPEEKRTASDFEALFCRLVRKAGLPKPRLNIDVHDEHGRYVARPDARWDEHALAVFLDGFAYHSSRPEFAKDRRQANELTRLGWRVLRYTWDHLTGESDRIISELQAFGLVAAR